MTVMMVIIGQQSICARQKGSYCHMKVDPNWFEPRLIAFYHFWLTTLVSLSLILGFLPLLSLLFNSLIIPSPARYFNIKMARGRKGVNGNSPAAAIDSPSDSTPTPPPRSLLPITPTPSKDRDVVKVNNASLSELKNALDDAIKRVRSILFRCTIAR